MSPELGDKAPDFTLPTDGAGNVTLSKLNGKKVVDDTPLENYWERGKPLPAKGPVELQHHGDKLWFKNIYIKELPD